jgi:hypothetical protein
LNCVALCCIDCIDCILCFYHTYSCFVLVWPGIVLALPVRTYIASKSKSPQDIHTRSTSTVPYLGIILIPPANSFTRLLSYCLRAFAYVPAATCLTHHAPCTMHHAPCMYICTGAQTEQQALPTYLPTYLLYSIEDDKQPSLAHVCIYHLRTLPNHGCRYVGTE